MSNADLVPSLFSPKSLQRAVESAIANTVPDDKHGALVAVVTTEGIRVAVGARMGAHWQVVGVLEKPHNGPVTGMASVLTTW